MSQFSVQRKTAIRKYQAFVEEGLKNNSVWSKLNNLICLGDEAFIKQVLRHMGDQDKDLQIPKIQKRSIAKSLVEYERMTPGRDKSIVQAYAIGAYSNQELGGCFGLHFIRIGKIVSKPRANG